MPVASIHNTLIAKGLKEDLMELKRELKNIAPAQIANVNPDINSQSIQGIDANAEVHPVSSLQLIFNLKTNICPPLNVLLKLSGLFPHLEFSHRYQRSGKEYCTAGIFQAGVCLQGRDSYLRLSSPLWAFHEPGNPEVKKSALFVSKVLK